MRLKRTRLVLSYGLQHLGWVFARSTDTAYRLASRVLQQPPPPGSATFPVKRADPTAADRVQSDPRHCHSH
jgi:hypothetical protein